jgi:hypothetical protein
VTARVGLASLLTASLVLGACQTDTGTAGCQITLEVPLAHSPLMLLPDARLDVVGDGFFLVGSDGTNVMWASLAANGGLGPEESLAIPSGTTETLFAFAQTAAPADTLLVGVVLPAANGTDAELHIITFPANGTGALATGPAILTFPNGAIVQPTLAMGTSRQGVTANLAWVDTWSGPTAQVMWANVDGMGQLSATVTVDAAAGIACLGYSLGEMGDMAVSFLRADAPGGLPTWEKSERTPNGGLAGLKLFVATTSSMGCAVGLPTSTGYALGWQDNSGSWLSVDYMPNGAATGSIQSFPFASATDFGGPDVQPPIVGLAPFAGDYGVLFSGSHAVELWRLDSAGNRRPGKLIFPSLEGNLGKVSAAWVGEAMVATYADYATSAGAPGQRWFVNAACY